MVPRLNLFGEISETDEEIILRIAQEAAEWRGYAVYDDFNEYLLAGHWRKSRALYVRSW